MSLIVDPVHGSGGTYIPRRGPKSFAEAGYCGRSFNQGMLRFHDSETGPNFRKLCFEAFPELASLDKKADVLAFDWNGKQYLTAKLSGHKDLQVLVADLGSGTVEELASVAAFAAVLKLPEMDDYFGASLYDQWRERTGNANSALGFTDCVSYHLPLNLGGEDNIDNLRMVDLDVAWTLGAQIRRQTAHLAPGERIDIRYD